MTKFKFGDKVRVLPQKEKPSNWLDDMMDYQNKEGIFIKAILGDYCVKFEDGPVWIYTKDQLLLVEDKGTQKVVIPKFVAEWIDGMKSLCNDVLRMSVKDAMDDLSLDIKGGHADEIGEWLLGDDSNWNVFVKAWLDGYTVEQPLLYTVEIPNPNEIGDNKHVLAKDKNGVVRITFIPFINYKEFEEFQLTEEEIKKDFEWAWKWAKPVEG